MLRPPEEPKPQVSATTSPVTPGPATDYKTPKPAIRTDKDAPLSSPSFLGLDDSGTNSPDYLLEEESPRGHGRMYVAFLLLLIAGGLIYWHWRQNGYPWVVQTAATSASVSTGNTSGQSVSQASQNTGTEQQPQPTSADNRQMSQPPATSTRVIEDTNTQQDSSADLKPGQAAENYSSTEISGAKTTGAQPTTVEPVKPETKPNPAENKLVKASGAPKPAKPAPVKSSPPTENVARLEKPQVTPPSAPEDAGAALALQGERYLYGNGIRQNCDLAQKSLLAAAARANVRSQILLGTMYATGHCATQSLPAAYRWYAKALHQDPENKRISDDLSALWRQMTPEERQQAIK